MHSVSTTQTLAGVCKKYETSLTHPRDINNQQITEGRVQPWPAEDAASSVRSRARWAVHMNPAMVSSSRTDLVGQCRSASLARTPWTASRSVRIGIWASRSSAGPNSSSWNRLERRRSGTTDAEIRCVDDGGGGGGGVCVGGLSSRDGTRHDCAV